MPTPTNFLAVVNEKGDRLHAPSKDAMCKALAPYASQEVVVTVELNDPATRGLRGYYFKVVVGAFSQYLTKKHELALPLSKDQTHELMTKAFLGVVKTELGETGKSTVGMNQEELWDYIEECCAHAASEWGLEIPLPERQ